MASRQNIYAFAWVLDIKHPTAGTIRLATQTLKSAAAVTTLGGFYRRGILSDIVVRRRMPDTFYGLDLPQLVSGVRLDNSRSTFDPTLEWREVPVIIRKYDLNMDLARTRFTGVIVDGPIFNDDGSVTVSFGSHLDALFDVALPTYAVSTSDFPTASDANAAIPKVYGRKVLVQCPHIALDEASDPGGWDFALTWGTDGSLEAAYSDYDSAKPGLETLSVRESAPGTPTYETTSTFLVSGSNVALTKKYRVGRPLRYKTTASGTSYLPSHISAFAELAGTPGSNRVTIAAANLDAGLNSVELDGDYVIETDRHAVDSSYMTTLRFSWAAHSVLAEITDATLENPADVIKNIYTSGDYGLSVAGGSMDNTAYTTVASALTALSLGSAVAGALGWDRRQRRAGTILAELCSFRGIRLSYDGDSEDHTIAIDSTPSAATLRLRANCVGTGNNVLRIEQPWMPKPLKDAVKAVKLHYWPGGRAVNGQLVMNDQSGYRYSIVKSGLQTVGATQEIFSPWIRSHAVARLYLAYHAMRAKYGDKGTVLVVGPEGFDTELGDLVEYTNPLAGLSAKDVQCWGTEESLAEIKLELLDYNAEIYSYTGSDITIPASDVDLGDKAPRPGTGSNRISNPDFSTKMVRANAPTGSVDTNSLPGWAIYATGGLIAAGAITVVVNHKCVGRHYLELTTAGTDANHTTHKPRVMAYDTTNGTIGGIAVEPLALYFCSVYCEQPSGWAFRVIWINSSGTLIGASTPTAISQLNQINGLGWYRYYAPVRAHAEAVRGYMELINLTAQTTRWDAVQFEEAIRGSSVPTNWNQNTPAAKPPNYMTAGELWIRASDDDPEAGMKWTPRWSQTIDLTGQSSVNLLDADGNELIHAGERPKGVWIVVRDTITFAGGGASYSVGEPGVANAWGSALAYTTIGDVSDDTDFEVEPSRHRAATHVTVTVDAGTFATGEVQALLMCEKGVAPTV